MTSFKLSKIFPCASFFMRGHAFLGLAALFMQMTIVFWPAASRWAEQNNERTGVEKLLAELSEAHRLDPYARPAKKFRQPA